MDTRRITPVILSGGSGTRLWPLSTDACPKQFIALTGVETMLQMTALRVSNARLFDEPVIVAGEIHIDAVQRQLDEIGVRPSRLILEPCARNTAPAIALAVFSGESAELLLVMPSDHLVGNREAFIQAVERAVPLAEQGWLVTFGIRPDHPETGYGYIRRAEQLAPGVFRALEFVEKPDEETAQHYVSSGAYDWNGGIFLFRADAFARALDEQARGIADAVKASLETAERDGVILRPSADRFAEAPSRSVDHAVMENADRIAVVPVDMAWSDIGSWDALYAIGPANADHNVFDDRASLIDSEGCLIRSDGPSVAAIGVRNLIIIATADAVLVLPRGQSQRVKEAVQMSRVSADRK